MNSKAWSPSAGGKPIAFCRTGDCATEYEAWTHEDTLKWKTTDTYGKRAAKREAAKREEATWSRTWTQYTEGDYELAEPIVHVEPDSPEVTELRRFIDSLDN